MQLPARFHAPFRAAISIVLVGSVTACASRTNKQGAKPQGMPVTPVSAEVLDAVAPPSSSTGEASAGLARAPRLPAHIIVPANYRFIMLDGQPAWVRETDPRVVFTSPAAQLVVREPGSGEVNLQPALLPAELGREIIATRAQLAALTHEIPRMEAATDRLIVQTAALAEAQMEYLRRAAATPSRGTGEAVEGEGVSPVPQVRTRQVNVPSNQGSSN